ncbi:hypothetical protein [Falsiroseomonas tokyonensis]|uniref:Uncharacterized protein n=1 Tax=Falsiroseomonas tokyonensis TaxID=430521 RepID=A0ABV7BRN5_9PROT|nr:hypothetical protein [Falsiroseomonas tokyonensis]MBU8538289.1 hypothetical protein [Falsiroseomonas tokyonensis]
MTWSLDARIPLHLASPEEAAARIEAARQAGVKLALLIPESLQGVATQGLPSAAFAPDGPRHAAACACCAGRPPVSAALDRLFQARVRGTAPWFDSVLAVVTDTTCRAEVETALMHDPLTQARFRPGF